MTFTALVGAMVLVAVARSGRLRLPVPAPALLVTGGVAASITVTVIFLNRERAAAEHLPPRRISPPYWPAACGSPLHPDDGSAPTGTLPISMPPPLSCSWPGSG
ncbi:hypothetical protein ACFVZW_06380 [Streptomyces sp. NPDC059567]|uniref:hypothetical protein n=1 Tax=Streptomyces sp. NPDC059567 TaxID=3346867 RepID=UPI0036C1C879